MGYRHAFQATPCPVCGVPFRPGEPITDAGAHYPEDSCRTKTTEPTDHRKAKTKKPPTNPVLGSSYEAGGTVP